MRKVLAGLLLALVIAGASAASVAAAAGKTETRASPRGHGGGELL